MAFCPPTSLISRHSALPHFDLSGGGGGGGSANPFVFSSSPVTPTRLWDEHIQEISRELEVICGSPRNRTRERLFSPASKPPPLPPSLTRHQSTGCMLRTSSSTSIFKPIPGLTSTTPAVSKSQRLFRVGSQDRVQLEPLGFHHLQEAPICYHRLVVRHEETRSKLTQQLALVCPIKSDELPRKRPFSGFYEQRKSDSLVIRRTTASKSGVLYKVPLNQRKSEELFVSFCDDHVIRICVDDPKGDEVMIEEFSVPTEVPVQSLVLSVPDDRWLYIQQRTEDATMVVDFTGTSAKYLPIIHENEARLRIEIFLRIPQEFDPEEVTVKTIDDSVVISGTKRSVTMTPEGDDGVVVGGGGRMSPPLTVGHLWSLPSSTCFVVILPLPSGTNSRSVSAYFTGPRNLLITGRLHPNRRRYSF